MYTSKIFSVSEREAAAAQSCIIVRNVQKLYNMGARKVVVASLGPLGCIPFQLTLRFSRNGECSEKVNAQAREFNAGLFGLIKELNANLHGAQFIYADAYKGVAEMIANPSAYGKYDNNLKTSIN